MNTQLKLFITALFSMGFVSIASAMTLTSLEIYGTPDNPASSPEGKASSYFYPATYFWDGVPYFHGSAHVEASATSKESRDFSLDGFHDYSKVTQTWEVQLKLGGDSNARSDVWVKYPIGDGNRNDTNFTLYTKNRADATYTLNTKLEYKVIEPHHPPTLIQTLIEESPTDYKSTSVGYDSGSEYTPISYSHHTTYDVVWLGEHPGGTIIDITGTFTAEVRTRAWGSIVPFNIIPGTAKAGVDSYLTFEAYATPVPEPETWAMMLVGGLLVAWQARRRGQHLPADAPLLGYMPS